MNGVTLPLRANNSQASSISRIENRPAPQRKAASNRRAGVGRKIGRRGRERGLILYSRHRSNRCMRS